jgi:hypothetical protein
VYASGSTDAFDNCTLSNNQAVRAYTRKRVLPTRGSSNHTAGHKALPLCWMGTALGKFDIFLMICCYDFPILGFGVYPKPLTLTSI